MHCYCRQLFNKYGEKGLKVLFEDGVRQTDEGSIAELPYCEVWHQVTGSEWQTTFDNAIYISFINIAM